MNINKIIKSLDFSEHQYFWRRSLIILIFFIAAILFTYINTVIQMVGLWSVSDTYAHGFIVPFISLWLIWRIRKEWMVFEPEKSWVALIIMLGAALVWLAGDLVAINAITQLTLVSMIILCVPAVLGWPVTKKMTFPLLFLYFSVPVGDFMLPTMMEWTADFTVFALKHTGIPVYREGLQFVIPSGNWSVVEACSGIRYLIASVTVGCLFAYINYRSYLKRLIFIIVSVVVPLIANWLRAYLIVLIGHYSGNELATGVDHLIYGWLFFGLVIILMLFIGARWADEPIVLIKSSILYKEKKLTNSNKYNKKFFLLIFFIILAPHLLVNWIASRNNELPVELENIIAVKPWKKLENSPSDWIPGFQHAAAETSMGFENEMGVKVGLHISYYRQQNYKSKLVTSSNTLVSNANKNWSQIFHKTQKVIIQNEIFEVNSSVLRPKRTIGSEEEKNLHIWNFYWVNGKLIANDVNAKVQGALGQILGNGDDGAIIAVYVPYSISDSLTNDLELTDKILQNFMVKNKNSIIFALKKTQEKK